MLPNPIVEELLGTVPALVVNQKKASGVRSVGKPDEELLGYGAGMGTYRPVVRWW